MVMNFGRYYAVSVSLASSTIKLMVEVDGVGGELENYYL
jgi:hypothetical protein